jgi:hypothetical protein
MEGGEGNNGTGAEQPREPRVVFEMQIKILDDNSVQVHNIPHEFDQAMNILANATRAVASLFVSKAMQGALKSGGGSGLLLPKGCGGIIRPS